MSPGHSEDLLQNLLADYPKLLAGEQMDSTAPRRWLLVRREMPVPEEEDSAGRWSLDHLFLDQDGVPTLIEVKRSTDTRLRREVVGQMLDYAANAVAYWPLERIRAEFELSCQGRGIEPDVALAELLGSPDTTAETFWEQVAINLRAGRIRMLFVADVIPTELRRVVEFLNAQMNPAEVLALEVKQYVGQGVRTLVPRLVGQTVATQQKNKASTSRPSRWWDEESFFAALRDSGHAAEVEVAQALLDWAKRRNLRVWWGKGASMGSFFPMCDTEQGQHWTFAVYTNGGVEIQFQHMQNRQPYGDRGKRLELLRALNSLPGIRIAENRLDKRPSVPLASLRDPNVLERFLNIFDHYVDAIQQAASRGAQDYP